ncbi:hypothetical protein MRX96_037849 [Rhipicephalus microplus]
MGPPSQGPYCQDLQIQQERVVAEHSSYSLHKAFSAMSTSDTKFPSDDEHGGSFPDVCGWKPTSATGRNVLASVAEAKLEHNFRFVLGSAAQVSAGELQFQPRADGPIELRPQ